MKTILPIITAVAFALLVIGGAITVIAQHGMPGIIGVGASVVLGWLVATWYFADDEPVFGRGTPARVTFKNVIANAVFDVVDLLRPLWLRVWLNLPFGAVIVLDAVALMQPEMRDAIVGNFWGGIALVVLNLVARYGSTAAHPPVATR